MPGLAGVAFDGSPWVTAASSGALVLVSAGMAVLGGALIARRVASGDIDLGPAGGMQAPESVQRRRSIPLEKTGERVPTELPPAAKSVDKIIE